VAYTCCLCGRIGHRQFEAVNPKGPLPKGAHRCTNRDKCKGRIREIITRYERACKVFDDPDGDPDYEPPKRPTPQAASRFEPAPPEPIGGPEIFYGELAARCQDCPRVWSTRNSRTNLAQQVQAHEYAKGHIVEMV
jgi:hypothetical protein